MTTGQVCPSCLKAACPGCEQIDDDPWPDCPTCHGRGTVNPLTAPADFFCVSTTDCPTCDGSGKCP
jgi:DnaJ-class molecular chaperone